MKNFKLLKKALVTGALAIGMIGVIICVDLYAFASLVNSGTYYNINGELMNDIVINDISFDNEGNIVGDTTGLTILTNTPITISNINPDETTTDVIEIESPNGANITFAGVNISPSNKFNSSPLYISYITGDVKIILAEGSVNVLSGGYACGILKDNTNNYLEITGTGYLEATASNNGAGIGDKSGGGVFAVTRKKINK